MYLYAHLTTIFALYLLPHPVNIGFRGVVAKLRNIFVCFSYFVEFFLHYLISSCEIYTEFRLSKYSAIFTLPLTNNCYVF